MINQLLTKKEIAYGTNNTELEQLLIAGKLPYLPATSDDDIHRPADLKLMLLENSIHTMPIEILMMYGDIISYRINKRGPDHPAFKPSPNQKVVSLSNVVITVGDLMQMLNDEYLYRMFHEDKEQYYNLTR